MNENIYRVGLNSYRNVYRESAKVGKSPVIEQLVNGVVDGTMNHIINLINSADLNNKNEAEIKKFIIEQIIASKN